MSQGKTRPDTGLSGEPRRFRNPFALLQLMVSSANGEDRVAKMAGPFVLFSCHTETMIPCVAQAALNSSFSCLSYLSSRITRTQTRSHHFLVVGEAG